MVNLPSTACPDWRDRLRDGRSIIPAPIFPDQAEMALSVLRQLKIVDAPGSPTMDSACAPWVFHLVSSIFGAYNAENGQRLIREWFVLIPKKNSKSTIAAAIMLTAHILNWRNSAEFTIIAPTVTVANNAFIPARDMTKHDEELRDMMHLQEHMKTIRHRVNESTLKVLAADSNTVGGTKSVGLLIDELHLFGTMSKAGSMFTEAMGGLTARPEGFVIWLTTQSDEPPAGVFREKLKYARDVRDGKINDPQFVPVLYEFPEDMIKSKEYLKPENFGVVNPNLGYSVDRNYLDRELKKAEIEGEDSLKRFCAKHLNVEVGLNLRSDRWAGADFWESCATEKAELNDILEKCEVIDVGIDGGGLDDLLGLAVAGRIAGSDTWLTWCHAWAHPSVLERRKSEAARFMDFAKDGHLTLVKQIGDDTVQVAEYVAMIEDAGLLDKVGVDPHGLGGILEALEEAEIPSEKIIGISQGWKLTGSIKTTERKLAEGRLLHGGQPMMAWCVGNAKVEPRGNAVTITKQAAGFAKIDPLMALFNAVSLLSLNPESMDGFGDFVDDPIILRM